MTTTPDLVDALVADAAPVRRLRAPVLRALAWLLFAALVLGLVGVNHGLRPDIVRKIQDAAYVTCIVAALLTAVLAAIAAFMLSLPDRPRRWLLLPAPALVVWLSTVAHGCLTGWVGIGPAGIRLVDLAECFATLVLTSVPIWGALLFMLRHAARLRPAPATMMASLAVAAVSATALLLFHPLDATAMILAWNVGGAALVLAIGCSAGRRFHAWFSPRMPAAWRPDRPALTKS